MFCFLDPESANLAADCWGDGNSNHFSPQYLAELELSNAIDCLKEFDANWITWAQDNPEQSLKDNSWIDKYWSGQPYSEENPIWETLFVGQIAVLGTNLRKRAYDRIKKEFPDSLALLEIARVSALLGSNLGSLNGFISNTLDGAHVKYLMNMQDANNPIFLKNLRNSCSPGNL